MIQPRKILLIQLRQLGDILLTTPCIAAARKLWPDAQIDFLSHRMGKLVLENQPHLNNLLTYNEQDGALDQLRLLRQLHSEKYDLVFDFMNNPRSLIFSIATIARQRRSYQSSRAFGYTEVFPRGGGEEYIVKSKLRLFGNLDFDLADLDLVLPWSESDLPNHDELRKSVPTWTSGKRRIILSPTHRRELRRWPFQKFAHLADHLVTSEDACIVWLWGPGERDVAESCQRLSNSQTFLAPPTTFRQMAALIAHADYFISTSNGPSHVAVAARTPSFQLHGPTSLRAWCPMTSRHFGIQAPSSDLTTLTLESVCDAIDLHLRAQTPMPRQEFSNWRQRINAVGPFRT